MKQKKCVFEKSMKLPIKYYDTHHSGDFISKLVYDTDKASEIYTSRLRRVAASIISVSVYVNIMFFMNFTMTSILIVFNIILLLLNTFLAGSMKKIGIEMAKKIPV